MSNKTFIIRKMTTLEPSFAQKVIVWLLNLLPESGTMSTKEHLFSICNEKMQAKREDFAKQFEEVLTRQGLIDANCTKQDLLDIGKLAFDTGFLSGFVEGMLVK